MPPARAPAALLLAVLATLAGDASLACAARAAAGRSGWPARARRRSDWRALPSSEDPSEHFRRISLRLRELLPVAVAHAVLGRLATPLRYRVEAALRVSPSSEGEQFRRWDLRLAIDPRSGSIHYVAAEPEKPKWSSLRPRATYRDGIIASHRIRHRATFMHLRTYGRMEAFLMLEEGSMAFLYCRDISAHSMFLTWEDERCAEVLVGFVPNVSSAVVWQERRCGLVAKQCPTVWALGKSSAMSRLPCWPLALLKAVARLAPDGKRLVIHSPELPLDYLWAFGDGHPPLVLQDPTDCTEAGRNLGTAFSPDSRLYATCDRAQIALFETATGHLASALPLSAGVDCGTVRSLGVQVPPSA